MTSMIIKDAFFGSITELFHEGIEVKSAFPKMVSLYIDTSEGIFKSSLGRDPLGGFLKMLGL